MSDIIFGLKSMDHALPDYLEAEDYYEGTKSELFTSEPIRRALGKSASQFIFNYARIVVTSRLARMEVASITSDDDAANQIIDAVWNANGLDQELQDAIESALVHGDSYLIVWPNEDETGVDVFYNDPKSTRVFYDPENPRRKLFAIKRWNDGEKLRVNIYYRDRIEKYISKDKYLTSSTEADFEQYFDEGQETWPLVNETGTIPVFHLRTGRMYGKPEHKSAYGPQNAINKIIATQVSSIDFATLPQRYFLEDPTASDGVDPASDFGDNGLVDDDDRTGSSNLRSGPGGIWSLKGVKDVGQFDVAPPEAFTVPFKTYIEAMSTVTDTPMHAFNVGALPSGESLRAAEAPLNKRTESLELLLGSVLREAHEFILDLLGYNDARVSVTWAPVGTYDDADLWATVAAKTAAGVPLRKALTEAGYTETQVEAWYPGDSLVRSDKDLATLADAIQKISAAVSLGVITADEARAMLPEGVTLAPAAPDLATVEQAVAEVPATDDAAAIKAKADALGILIRAGVDPDEAAQRVGLAGVEFTGAMPTSLRLPQADANKLEGA